MPHPSGGTSPQIHWPPRSPQEALASTPSGRERLRRMHERVSPSPSPLKKTQSAGNFAARVGGSRGGDIGNDDDDDVNDEDEDEEILQLKLQAIEAKLKLKELQKRQKRPGEGSGGSGSAPTRPGHSSVSETLAASRAQSRAAVLLEGPKIRPQSQAETQVPVSPVRRANTAQEQRSPSRIVGIDKGLRAKDVSLKRAPSLRKTHESHNEQGGYLRRAHTPAPAQDGAHDRPSSFSSRMAAAKTEDENRRARLARIKAARSKNFEIGEQQMEIYKSEATEIPEALQQPEVFSREEVLSGGHLKRCNTVTGDRPGEMNGDLSSSSLSTASEEAMKRLDDKTMAFDSYSGFHLSKRIMPHRVLARTLAGKTTCSIQHLLRDVKYPEFDLPEVEQDVVAIGILASKSEPKSHKAQASGDDLKEAKGRFAEEKHRGKFMILHLVDLQYELDLFLFDGAFHRYYKLTPGTVVAVLNPSVMPPPKGREHSGRFSLVLNSDGDSILEIGTARDLGFCKSIKKDGSLCNSWVNQKRTEFCEYHMNLELDRHRVARQEINSGNGIGPNNRKLREKTKAEEERKRRNWDHDTQSHFYVSKATTASLIDGFSDERDRIEKSQSLRKRHATQEKERELMKKLSKTGGGQGREYMRMASHVGPASAMDGSQIESSQSAAEEPGTRGLDLISGKSHSSKIHLSPIKRKRADSSYTSNSSIASSAEPRQGGFGWGGSLKDKLTRMREGEKLDGSKARSGQESDGASKMDPPARKKTRFVTEKGIREAGRESLGGADLAHAVKQDDEDDDDELVIL